MDNNDAIIRKRKDIGSRLITLDILFLVIVLIGLFINWNNITWDLTAYGGLLIALIIIGLVLIFGLKIYLKRVNPEAPDRERK